jgi:hypothetical protein
LHRSAGDALREYVNSLPVELIFEDREAQLYRVRAQSSKSGLLERLGDGDAFAQRRVAVEKPLDEP